MSLASNAVLGIDGPHPVGDVAGGRRGRLHMVDVMDSELAQRSPQTYRFVSYGLSSSVMKEIVEGVAH